MSKVGNAQREFLDRLL